MNKEGQREFFLINRNYFRFFSENYFKKSQQKFSPWKTWNEVLG